MANEIQQAFTLYHVEVCLKDTSTAKQSDIKSQAFELLYSREFALKLNESNNIEIGSDFPLLSKNVQTFVIYCEPKFQFSKDPIGNISLVSFKNQVKPQHIFVHVCQLNEDEGEEEMDDDDSSESNSTACKQWVLPSKHFHGLWDSLVFDDDIKTQLLDYVTTTLLFSDKHVDHNIVSWNRVVLLHGPPGTGKTSLCKALAQKLAVRMSERYRYGQLIEINSHSLFSKWFSESGKLVMKLFSKIREMIEEKDCFVCVLIDEVESLTAARKAALSGTEPSDAIRVVNAVLTQIDQLKNCDNALILTTSNITGAIDLAFVDRADIKQFIGLPSTTACYHILSSCIQELTRVGIITTPYSLLDYRSLEHMSQTTHTNETVRCSLELFELSKQCQGLSGRALRKLPFLAHAFFIQSHCTLDQFLHGLRLAIEKEYKGRQLLAN